MKECQADGEAKSGRKKSSIWITHENCEGSISLIRRMTNSRKPSRMPIRNSCKIMKKNCRSGASNEIKTRLACILEASESTRLRMGDSLPNHHEDHIAGKEDNPLQHYNLVHKFIPMPQAMNIPVAEAAVDKEWENLEKFWARNLTKVRIKKEVIDEARTKGAKVHFRELNKHISRAEEVCNTETFSTDIHTSPPLRHKTT